MKQRSDVLGYCSDMLNCRLRADALRRGTDVGLSAAKTDVSYLDKQTCTFAQLLGFLGRGSLLI